MADVSRTLADCFDRISALPDGPLSSEARREIFERVGSISAQVQKHVRLALLQEDVPEHLKITLKGLASQIDSLPVLTKADALAFLTMATGMKNVLQAYTPAPPYCPISEERLADAWESHRSLLRALFANPGQAVPFVTLIRAISGDSEAQDNPRTRQNLALVISRLPSWIKEYGSVQSVRAIGYRWVEHRN